MLEKDIQERTVPEMKNLYQYLAEYGNSDYYGFHMPGHKRNKIITDADLPYHIDITEIDGFDDLHHAGGILLAAQQRAARVYGAEETRFLVGGSTAGILSAVMGSTRRGDKILMCRNCHKSVYNAVVMKELVPLYLYPWYDEETELNGEVSVRDVVRALGQEPDVRAVVVVSPTYDGVVSDIAGIAAAAHQRGIPLIVDEAHGAHFGFHPDFPQNANRLGADIVIHSLHKTMPALTQSALIHMNGVIADREGIRNYLAMLQSSSPSYILMAGIDACIDILERSGRERFGRYAAILGELRRRLQGMANLKLLVTPCYDLSKIVISTRGTKITGKKLFDRLLNDYHLQLEMAAGSYVVAMTSIADTQEGFTRLAEALTEIDAALGKGGSAGKIDRLPQLERIYTEAEIKNLKTDRAVSLPWAESVDYISLERAYLYPPGIPLIVPGERISPEAVDILESYRGLGFEMQGLKEEGKIEVLTDGKDILSDGKKFYGERHDI